VAETIWSRDIEQHLRKQLPWTFECKEEHRYFAASLVWRTLVWGHPEDEKTPFTDADRACIATSTEKLGKYLRGAPYPDPPWPWLHLVTPPHGFTGAPPGLNVYLRGSLDAATMGRRRGLYTIVNLAAYLVVAVLRVDAALITWTLGTELRPGSIVHKDPRRVPDDVDFRRILMERAAAFQTVKLSDRQQQIVNDRVEAAIDPSLRHNEHAIAMMMDYLNCREASENHDSY